MRWGRAVGKPAPFRPRIAQIRGLSDRASHIKICLDPNPAGVYSVPSTLYRVLCTGYSMTDSKRPLTNPLALAILVLLYERPMHPYEMATTLRESRKESSIRLNYGSLYAVIEQLLREKFIAVREILKEGKHPAKTVYELRSLG